MTTATTTKPIPLLLPEGHIPKPVANSLNWTPKRYLTQAQPPPIDENRQQEEQLLAANAKLVLDGKIIKKTRPRKTVDYNGGLGRWALLRKHRPSPNYLPHMRPCPPSIIDLLPPIAYQDNPSTSLCTKFVHTSTNKIRCPVNVVTWTPEARRVLTGSTSGEFTLWNGLTFNFETILQAHDTAICAMTFTHSGAYLVSSDKTGIIKYFEPNMNNLTAWQGSNAREAIRGISFSPDDSRFVTASDDSSIRIWSFQESKVESVLTGHGWDVKCVEWHPTKGLLVSGSKDNQIKFWDPRTGTVLSTLHHHKNTIQALQWSPNGNFVASASRDQTVRVFDIRAMKEFRILKGHKKEVCSVAWHPIHELLVSGGSDGSMFHWDLATDPTLTQPVSQPRASLPQAHDSNVWSLAFHPLGHLLVSASNDYTTRFWSRERPGDATSGGDEKPPDETMNQEDDEDSMMVPGFGVHPAGGGQGWWSGKDDTGANSSMNRDTSRNSIMPPFGGNSGGGGPNGPNSYQDDDFIPGFGGGGGGGQSSSSGGIPGLGVGPPNNYGGGGGSGGNNRDNHDSRYNDRNDRDSRDQDYYSRDRDRYPPPPRDDSYGNGGGDDWGRNGGHGHGGGHDDWNDRDRGGQRGYPNRNDNNRRGNSRGSRRY